MEFLGPNPLSRRLAALTALTLASLVGCLGGGETQDQALLDRLAAMEARNQELSAELERAASLMEDGLDMRYTTVPLDEAPEDLRNRVQFDSNLPPSVAASIERSMRDSSGNGSQQPAARLPGSSHALIGTVWIAGPTVEGEFVSFQFGETLFGFSSHASPAISHAIVEYSAIHPACLNQPLCVVTMEPTGEVIVRHFYMSREELKLWPMSCVDWGVVGDGGPIPSADDLRTNAGRVLLHRTERVMCFRDVDGLELTLFAGEPR